jgi:hypothetical protein
MAFFAVLRDPADAPPGFAIRACHVNLWVLKGLFGRRNFIWDLGLEITPGIHGFQRFQIAVPSGIADDGLSDLYDKLVDQNVAQLIFGRPVTLHGNTINYGSGQLRLSRVPPAEAQVDRSRSGRGFTIWNLKLGSPVPTGTDTYLRVRFVANDIGRLWTWRRFGFAHCGSLTDVRFSDVREASDVKDGESLQDRILPIEKLCFFVIAPSFFHLIATSPSLHYIRILEGRAWESYLSRRVSLFGEEKLTIYQWRNPVGSPVTNSSPLRVYLDLGSQFGLSSLLNGLALLVVGILICTCGTILAQYVPAIVSVGLSEGTAFAKEHVTGVTITTVAVFLFGLSTRIERTRNALRSLRKGLMHIESWVFSKK